MTNEHGLDITEEQFCNMTAKERDLIMFKNMVALRTSFIDYKLHRKIQYVWLSALTTIAAASLGLKRYIGII